MRTESSTTKRLLKLIAGISALSLCAASSVFALPTEQLPDFSRMTLTPESQAAAFGSSTIPNALASYYTYIPLSNADAVALGFPSACGNPNTVTNPLTGAVIHTPLVPGDSTSTADCYVISLRQFSQPTSLEFLKFVLPSWAFILANGGPGTIGGNLFPGQGLVDAAGVPFVRQDTFANFAADSQAISAPNNGKMTWAQGYGSGGAGWQPHGAAGPTVRGSAPWAFQDTPFNYLFGTAPTGDQSISSTGVGGTGLWHFPAPTIKGTVGRPVYVQWLNDLANVWIEGFDPAIDCGHGGGTEASPNYCYPYNREVVHVHGAHVGPESDGLATAWYTPNYALFGEGDFTQTAYNWPGVVTGGANPLKGKFIYKYPMDTEASTIWYHTHAVGITHLNTNAGQAGFFPVTDANELAMITASTPSAPAKKLPNGAFEHGFALQERHFDTTGEMRMPDAARYDRTTPGCVMDANGLPDPATCDRLQWMYQLGNPALSGAQDPTPAFRLVPYNAAAPEVTNVANPAYAKNNPDSCTQDTVNRFANIKLDGTPFVQCAPFPAVEGTLEYIGNIPVVNGVVNGNYNLEAGQIHRMRLIGGTDSRTWVLQLVKTAGAACGDTITCDPTGTLDGANFRTFNPAAIIPFWQIGSEQGFLNTPVQRDFIDLMGGERVDVLVDLTGIPAGTTIMMKNVGVDGPYTGIFELGIEPSSTLIPEVMKFTTVADASGITKSIAPSTGFTLRPASLVPPTATTGEPVRNVSLIEITDQYGNTMPTVDARGYIPPGMMNTEYIKLDNTEIWDIINTTVDAHPMHIHQVAFQTLKRAAITTFDPPDSNTLTKVFSQPSYTATGGAITQVVTPLGTVAMTDGVSAYDKGWKDTIQCPPGYVTRVIATWDFEGEYVWHCHILSHEEHDMMRPFVVVNTSAVAPPAWLGAQANNGQGTVKLWWPAVAGATGYVIHESQDNFATSNYAVTTGAVTSALLKNKSDGTYKYRIAAIMNGNTQTSFRTMPNAISVNKTVAAPDWVGASAVPKQNFIKVWWAASTTPNTFASAEGNLHYPVEYLVSYDVTATLTIAPFTAYTTRGITGTTNNISAFIGDGTFDPTTGAANPLPNGTYNITLVANKPSWKTSGIVGAANPVTVNVTNVAPAYLGAQKNGTTVKIWWPTIAGQVMQIMDGVTDVTPGTIQTSGALSYFLLTGVSAGSHTYTIQNVALPGVANASAIVSATPITIP